MMVIGISPFVKASKKEDAIYMTIFKKNWDEFWSLREKRPEQNSTEEHKISSEFKDLIENMLKHEAFERLTLKQVK